MHLKYTYTYYVCTYDIIDMLNINFKYFKLMIIYLVRKNFKVFPQKAY